MESDLDLSKFWCWQKDCPDYGKMGAGNIVLKERYGKENRALLKCKTCSHCFSETHGRPSSVLTHQWMKSVEHWHRFQKKEAFGVLLGHLAMIKVRYADG